MKKVISFCFLTVLTLTSFAQKETFDLVTYTPPSGWTKNVTDDITSYTLINKTDNSWCVINIMKSTDSKGSIEKDFESEWQGLVVRNYKPADAPQAGEPQEADGWKIKAGGGKFIFNKSDAIVILTTATGFNKCVSIVATTNNETYIKDIDAFLTSIDLKKPEINTQLPAGNENGSVVGTWGLASTVASYANMGINEGTIITQYRFNANGTYSFYIKTFRYQLDKLLLTRETGTYQVNGNSITLSPTKSAIEAWTKKNGTDEFGTLISSQKKDLEKTTYRFFTKDFGSGLTLVFQANAVTKRDGPFNNIDKDAWLYPSKSAIEILTLPGGKQMSEEELVKEPAKQAAIDDRTTVIGTWAKNSSVNPAYGDAYATSIAGYTKNQYMFASNGTYTFTAKTFGMSLEKILLVRENGTYQISGNNIVITPQKSEIEAWSKKNGGDDWGKLLSVQKRPLEKISYQFSKYYFTGIQQWNLVLQSDKTTLRDGPFSNNTTFANAWYYVPISANNPVIDLPGNK